LVHGWRIHRSVAISLTLASIITIYLRPIGLKDMLNLPVKQEEFFVRKVWIFFDLLFELFVLTFCSTTSNKCNSTQTRHSMYIEIQTCPVRSYKTFWGEIYSFIYRTSVLYCDRHFYPSLIFAVNAWNILKLQGAPLRWAFAFLLKTGNGYKFWSLSTMAVYNFIMSMESDIFSIVTDYRGRHWKGITTYYSHWSESISKNIILINKNVFLINSLINLHNCIILVLKPVICLPFQSCPL
jgi:hypothetical protein